MTDQKAREYNKMNVTKKFATGYLSYKTGSEGPRHDPYGYHEWSFCRNGRKVVLHEGLGEWVKIDGETVENGDAARLTFEKEVGITVNVLERAMHRVPKCCNKPRIASIKGYPGETLYVCSNCDKVVGGSFNEAAVI